MTLITRIYTDKNKLKIRDDQRNPRYPRSMIFLVSRNRDFHFVPTGLSRLGMLNNLPFSDS